MTAQQAQQLAEVTTLLRFYSVSRVVDVGLKQEQNNETNMNIKDIYRSTYMKADDLSGRTAKHTISGCTAEKVGDDERLVLSFSENDRPLVLNKTNANSLAELYGPETGAWEGNAIKLVPSTTSFQGKMVKCIRISPERVANDV